MNVVGREKKCRILGHCFSRKRFVNCFVYVNVFIFCRTAQSIDWLIDPLFSGQKKNQKIVAFFCRAFFLVETSRVLSHRWLHLPSECKIVECWGLNREKSKKGLKKTTKHDGIIGNSALQSAEIPFKKIMCPTLSSLNVYFDGIFFPGRGYDKNEWPFGSVLL